MNAARMATKSTNRKRKVKRGILGHPKAAKRNRILFFTRVYIFILFFKWPHFKWLCFFLKNFSSSESDSDDCLDPDYSLPECNDVSDDVKRPTVKRRGDLVTSSSSTTEASTNANWSSGVPYELLFKIFEYYARDAHGNVRELDRLKAVCKYWSHVADDPKLWWRLDMCKLLPPMYVCASAGNSSKQAFPNANHAKFTRRLKAFISRSQFKLKQVHILNLNNLAYLDCDGLEIVLSKCEPNMIREINLSNCPRLHHVSSKNHNFESILSRSYPNLTSLHLDKIDVKFFVLFIFFISM